jgi:hypothetical protein
LGAIAFLACAIAVNGLSVISIFSIAAIVLALWDKEQSRQPQHSTNSPWQPASQSEPIECSQAELVGRIVDLLYRSLSVLVVCEQQSVKTALRMAIASKLQAEPSFYVAYVIPDTLEEMSFQAAYQVAQKIMKQSSKRLNEQELQKAIAYNMQKNTFIIVEDAEQIDPWFIAWHKQHNHPMLLLATHPPKADVFLDIPTFTL